VPLAVLGAAAEIWRNLVVGIRGQLVLDSDPLGQLGAQATAEGRSPCAVSQRTASRGGLDVLHRSAPPPVIDKGVRRARAVGSVAKIVCRGSDPVRVLRIAHVPGIGRDQYGGSHADGESVGASLTQTSACGVLTKRDRSGERLIGNASTGVVTRVWIVTLLAGIGVVVGDGATSILGTWPSPRPPVEAIFHAAVGGAWIAAGLVAWARRPALRIGRLMCAVGFIWLVSEPWWPAPLPATEPWWPDALPATFHLVLSGLTLAVGFHAVLAFPTGRLDTGPARGVVAGLYVTGLIGNLVLLMFWAPADGPCLDCPRNLLLVRSSPRVVDAVAAGTTAVAFALGVMAVVLLARQWRVASRAGRDVLGPVVWSGLLGAALGIIQVAVDEVIGAPGWLSRVLFFGSWLTLALIPLAFLVGLLRARLRRGAMTGLMVELGRLPAVDGVREALARALGDPSLRLVFWRPESGGYIDPDGSPTTLPADDPGSEVTVLEHGGQRFGALIHDPFMLEDSTMLEAVGAAGRLAIENARLQAQLRAQLAEARASRARIVDAGDTERRRIERDLHDGAQQRLVSLLLNVNLARRATPDGQSELHRNARDPLLDALEGELVEALAELRTLASGILPPILTEHGLQAAIEDLASRSPLTVTVEKMTVGRLALSVEVAAYFVASEALTNVVKHAGTPAARLRVALEDGRLLVEVSDDGVGGAKLEHGTGLRGLADRVGALDGQLKLDSRLGNGTTIRAEIPCAS
jgi:signal transduction histidine kinase